MKFQQVMAFFLTGATALSISTTALAADASSTADVAVSSTQTAAEQNENLYVMNDKDLTDAQFETKYELPADSWFTPAVRYVIENEIMSPSAHMDGTPFFQWRNPAENRSTVARAIYQSAQLLDPSLTAFYANYEDSVRKDVPDFDEIPEADRSGVAFCFASGIMRGDNQHRLRPNDSISREEFATVLQNYVFLLEGIGKYILLPDSTFTDAAAISPWAKNAVSFCQTRKLMNGDTHGAFNPKGQIKSVELAQVLYNLSQQVK